MSAHKIICGKSETELKQFDDNTFDSCVTDPPYGIGFMNREWDNFKSEHIAKEYEYDKLSRDKRIELGYSGDVGHAPIHSPAAIAGLYDQSLEGHKKFYAFVLQWATELYRVMKPGAHILVFGGDRTEHRMKCAIEDAGFEIRGTIVWIYGSGFPKSLDISKSLDKMAGEKPIKKEFKRMMPDMRGDNYAQGKRAYGGDTVPTYYTDPTTEEAIQWNGWGTGLKPAVELICMARKPISERNIASNVLKWGVGGINVDGCRIGYKSEVDRIEGQSKRQSTSKGQFALFTEDDNFDRSDRNNIQGRFPANLILECCCEDDELVEGVAGIKTPRSIEKHGSGGAATYLSVKESGEHYKNEQGAIHTNPNCVCRMLDAQSGELTSGLLAPHHMSRDKKISCYSKWKEGTIGEKHNGQSFGGDKGGASRFFYQAKASQNERWFYCTICKHAYPMKERDKHIHGAPEKEKYKYLEFHPTQKPEDLISYLMRLITPPNGTTIDPFLGSGTAIIASEREGFNCVGIDSKPEYCEMGYVRGKAELAQQKISGERSMIERIGF